MRAGDKKGGEAIRWRKRGEGEGKGMGNEGEKEGERREEGVKWREGLDVCMTGRVAGHVNKEMDN